LEETGTRKIDSGGFPFELQYELEGVYVELSYRPDVNELLLTPKFIVYVLGSRGLDDFNMGTVVLNLRKKERRFQVAPPQEPKDADSSVYVETDKGGMRAYMVLVPPCRNGRELLPAEILSQVVNDYNIAGGLIEEAVTKSVQDGRYYEVVEIANGRLPVNGANGRINILFQTAHDSAPRMDEHGNVDYKSLDLFAGVKKDDVLAVRVPAQPGVPGFTVLGKELPAKNGREANMPRGKNVRFSEDGNVMVAEVDGRADIVNGRVEVSTVYTIPGDVDMGIGNIDFNGDVRVMGGVITGLTIRATGNIEVSEVVERAMLIADKNIILRKGVQGMDRALIKAGGDVISRFIERCLVETDGSVHADYIVYSNVTARKSVVLRGKHGKLIGGVTRAGKEVVVRLAGTPTGEKTIIELGPPPRQKALAKEKQTQMEQTQEQIKKIDSLLEAQGDVVNESPERMRMWSKLLSGREQLQKTYDEQMVGLNKLLDLIQDTEDGKLHVYGEAYHDVKVLIDGAAFTVKDTIPYATFKKRDGEIVFASCDKNERGE
jgi:uncharacterized protein (DUF342 family)